MSKYSFRAAFHHGTGLQRHPLGVSLQSFFLIRYRITARSKSLTTRCDSVFFIPKNPLRPEYFLPLCLPLTFPLVVVGSLSAHINVNGSQQHTVSQHGEPILAFKWPVRGPALFLQHWDVMDIHLELTFALGCFCFEQHTTPGCCWSGRTVIKL